jgi:hypothetical protein
MNRFRRLDLVGNLIVIISLVMLLLVLQWGGTKHPWKSAMIVGLLVGFVGGMSVFVAWQKYLGPAALFPLRIISQKIVMCSFICAFCLSDPFTNFQYYLPQWFQAIRNASPLQSRVDIFPWALGSFHFPSRQDFW